MNIDEPIDTRPLRVLIYTLIPTDRACIPIPRGTIAYCRNQARRMMELALWRLTGVWRGRHSTFKDATNTNRGDIAIRMGVKKQLTLAFAPRHLLFIEIAWGELTHALALPNQFDLAVIAGGGFIFAGPDGRLPSRFAADILALTQLTCPIVATSIGLNSLISEPASPQFYFRQAEQDKLSQFLNLLTLCSVRDKNTQQALHRDGFAQLPVIVDPGFLLATERAPLIKASSNGRLMIGINFAFHGPHTSQLNRRSLPILVRALRRVQYETQCEFHYFVHSDAERGIADALRLSGIKLEIINGNVEEMLDAYQKVDIHIAQMLHSAILAMSVGTPTLSLSYDIKSSGFFELFNLNKLCISLASINENAIFAAVIDLIANRHCVTKVILENQVRLRCNARQFYVSIAQLTLPTSVHAPANFEKPDSSRHTPVSDNTSVTTIVPAYNAASFIARALDSVLAQNFTRSEIIVVDDGSTDKTRDIVKTYEARGVRLICHPNRQGASAARNTGINESRGEYIAFLDADDEWLPTKIAQQLQVLLPNSHMSFVSCRTNLVDEFGRDNGDIYQGAQPAIGRDAWRTILSYPCVATPSVLVRKSALLKVGGFNVWLPVGEDQDMWIRLSMLGDVGHVSETLVRVHSTPNSLSKRNFREQASYVLPMIAAYVARAGETLSSTEKRKILGERFGKMGRSAYANGELIFGLRTLMRSVGYGYQPFQTFIYLIKASAMMRWLKFWAKKSRRSLQFEETA